MLLSTQHKMDVWEDVWVTNIVVGLNGDFFYVMIWRAGIGKKSPRPGSSSRHMVGLLFINSHV